MIDDGAVSDQLSAETERAALPATLRSLSHSTNSLCFESRLRKSDKRVRLSPWVSSTLRRVVDGQMILTGADLSNTASSMGIPSSSLDRLLKTDTSWSTRRARAAADWLARHYDADPERVLKEITSIAGPTLPFLLELTQCIWLIPDEQSVSIIAKQLVEMWRGRVLRLSTLLPQPDMLISELRNRIFDSASLPTQSCAADQKRRLSRVGSLMQSRWMNNPASLPDEMRLIWPAGVEAMVFERQFPFDRCRSDLLDELQEFWKWDCAESRAMIFRLLPETGVGDSILRRFGDFSEVELVGDHIMVRRIAGRAVWQLFDARDSNPATQSIIDSATQVLRLADQISEPMNLERIRRKRA